MEKRSTFIRRGCEYYRKLDTIVALMAGFIIIPACFAYGIEPGAGPSLIFITIPNIFAQVAGGRVWGRIILPVLSFAAFTTLVAVFENIISFDIDLFGWSRKKSTLVKSDSDHYLKYAMCYGIQCIGRIHSTWRRIDNHGSGGLHRIE